MLEEKKLKNRFKIGDHVYIVECGLYAKEVVKAEEPEDSLVYFT